MLNTEEKLIKITVECRFSEVIRRGPRTDGQNLDDMIERLIVMAEGADMDCEIGVCHIEQEEE